MKAGKAERSSALTAVLSSSVGITAAKRQPTQPIGSPQLRGVGASSSSFEPMASLPFMRCSSADPGLAIRRCRRRCVGQRKIAKAGEPLATFRAENAATPLQTPLQTRIRNGPTAQPVFNVLILLEKMARPERFERPTLRFVV